MEIVNFEINTQLRLQNETSCSFTFKKLNTSIYIFGEAIGTIIDEKVLKSEDLISFLKENIDDIELIKKYVRNSIGAFYIIIINKEYTHIICSYSSPGLLYTKHDNIFYFSNSEKFIFSKFGKKSKINQEILLNTVTSHQILLRPPFCTFFNNINRLPSATGLIIQNDTFKTNLDIMLANEIPDDSYKTYSLNNSIKRFGFLIENTIRLIVEFYKKNNKKLELLFSGGIDSSVLMIALKKTGSEFYSRHNAYNGDKTQDLIIAKKIAQKLDVKLFVQSKIQKPDISELIKISTAGLGTNVTPYQLTIDLSSKSLGKKETINMISGQNLDTLYHVDAFAPGSSTFFPQKILHTLYFLPHRIMYSDLFLSNKKKKWLLRFWPFCVKKKDLKLDFKKYIFSILTPIREHGVPLNEKKDLDDSILEDIIKKNKLKNIFDPINNYLKRNNLNTILQNSSSLQKISLIKMFRWYRTVNNVPLNYHNLQIGTNINRHIPYTDGPIANFFLKKKLSISEMFFIKEIMFKYFKKEVGTSYSYFCKNNKLKTYILFFNLIFKKTLEKLNFRRKTIQSNKINFYTEITILNQIRLSDRKLLLDLITKKEIRNYFENLYKTLDNPNDKVTREKIMMLCRLVNLENILHSLK